MAPTADAPYQCCINYNGLSFQSSSNAEGCTICIGMLCLPMARYYYYNIYHFFSVFAFFDNTGITNSLSIKERLYSGFEVTFQNVKGSLSNPLVFEFKSSGRSTESTCVCLLLRACILIRLEIYPFTCYLWACI